MVPSLPSSTSPPRPLAGAGAAQPVDAIDPQPGQTVLVHGASGGVDTLDVQQLVARGARVIASASPTIADRLIALGATWVIDHTAGPVAEQLRSSHLEGIDALINLGGLAPATTSPWTPSGTAAPSPA